MTIGYASGVIPSISLEHLLQRNVAIIGVWTYAVHYPDENEHSAAEIVRLWQCGALRPEVDLVLPMDRFHSGLSKILRREVRGKVVLIIESHTWAEQSSPAIHQAVALPRAPDKRAHR